MLFNATDLLTTLRRHGGNRQATAVMPCVWHSTLMPRHASNMMIHRFRYLVSWSQNATLQSTWPVFLVAQYCYTRTLDLPWEGLLQISGASTGPTGVYRLKMSSMTQPFHRWQDTQVRWEPTRRPGRKALLNLHAAGSSSVRDSTKQHDSACCGRH